MKTQKWMARVVAGVATWAAIGLGISEAASVISPVDGSGQPITATFTASIFDLTGNDITDVWLPEWRPTGGTVASGGTPVYVVFHDLQGNALVPSTISLVTTSGTAPNGSTNPSFNPLATSAYPGQCTNFGSPTDLSADFDLAPTGLQFTTPGGAAKTGFLLTPLDCGGMAVISVTTTAGSHTFILPKTSRTSGIPDIWAAAFCTSGIACTTGAEDADSSTGNATNGDGISAFDEYRGFIVSGAHIRTDPRRKDLFVHVVNPQCIGTADPTGSAASLLGGPNAVVTTNPLFSNVDTLISGTQIHRLDYATPNAVHYTTNEWVDRFYQYTVANGLQFLDAVTAAITTTAPGDDRQINRNAVFFTPDATGKPTPQKGLRIIECVDATTSPSLLGFASIGSPNGQDNAIIFTQRIVNYFTNSLGANCSSTPCLYSTFRNGAWTTPVAITQADLFGVAFAFYLAMEIGHTTVLTPSVEGTAKVSYGYHHAPGTGSNMDQGITNKTTRAGNTFYIPQLYNTSDLTNYKLK